jgi:hypothetical protein
LRKPMAIGKPPIVMLGLIPWQNAKSFPGVASDAPSVVGVSNPI